MTIARLVSIGLFLLPLCAPNVALAEGDCPPGFYRYTNPGHPGNCVPIPQTREQQTGPKWRETWGAIAMDHETGSTGVTVKAKSERTARKEATDRCKKEGGTNCRIALTYANQCASIAGPKEVTGRRSGSIIAAANEYESERLALESCEAKGGEKCEIFYTDCSPPMLIH
ncbi:MULTISPECIES: DUF4189 domain-containing protein [unclassified Lysobacter]|uniref:DUF4189 domain-containing protein n=1 Tax=unclassified Lysobacter TaxID=2635362 RepID=UPI001BE5986A|nr:MULTISPECIES: DUF4189 domain-containing protein [unclassified Lysobacter]MBT2748313.1 DUF4189 domain-containing protein [Lysobacter sp. ISL-42]MBT2749920.1 DUF4189 domain-containing protein [Lysobacter sp. ISL-50]MBT2781248.1 DUF4189 domain-containing protein [Lysobacter sp. ISL-52]